MDRWTNETDKERSGEIVFYFRSGTKELRNLQNNANFKEFQ